MRFAYSVTQKAKVKGTEVELKTLNNFEQL